MNEEDVELMLMLTGYTCNATCSQDVRRITKHLCETADGICISNTIRSQFSVKYTNKIKDNQEFIDTMGYVLYMLSLSREEYGCYEINCNDYAWKGKNGHTYSNCKREKIRSKHTVLYTLRNNIEA